MFYKQIYGTVFLLVVSFFRKPSPGRSTCRLFLPGQSFHSCPDDLGCYTCNKTPRALANSWKSGAPCRLLSGKAMPCYLFPTSWIIYREKGLCLEMAKLFQTTTWTAGRITHLSLTTWVDKGELNHWELVLSPPSFHAESMSRDNFLIAIITFLEQFIKRLSGHDANQQFKAIDLSS